MSELLSRGINVNIIINNDSKNMRYVQQINNLTSCGAKIMFHDAVGIMHHKFCITDRSVCLFGSYNWTKSAEYNNIEDLNICDEPQLVYAYLREFYALQELSKTDIKLLRNPRRCQACGMHKANILIVEQEGDYQSKLQMVEICGCFEYCWHAPEYYDISVYNNYIGIIEHYDNELEYYRQLGDEGYLEEIKAREDFDIAMYWSNVRNNRLGFVIIHAVGMPRSRMYGRHEEEHFYHMVWKERGMEKYIPDEIPMD